LQQGEIIFDNKITYTMQRGNEGEIVTPLNTQGKDKYLRDYDPPYEDTQYSFMAYDKFGIEKKDEVKYIAIVPYATLNEPKLPEKDPESAPVPVKFTCKPYNVGSEYVWRFGDGDSAVYNLEYPYKEEPFQLAPDTIEHTYYTPRKQGYNVTLKVTSLTGCTYVTEPITVTVDEPLLDVANVFTPNGDGMNDYFKPNAISLRGFEILIFTRTGKRVYYYRGNNLRDWEGWDGRIENTGKDASEGVYYYTVKAWGWDEPATKNPQTGPYKGFFYLYR
jgi:gliding motility-associated-like protein